MKQFYIVLVTVTLLAMISTASMAEELPKKHHYKYASLYFSSILVETDDKPLVVFTIDYDEGTTHNISLSEKGAMGAIVNEVCKKMAEMYSGRKTALEKWSKMKILNLLGDDEWEIIHVWEKDITDNGIIHIEKYFLKKEM
jgi:hypothetical protein